MPHPAHRPCRSSSRIRIYGTTLDGRPVSRAKGGILRESILSASLLHPFYQQLYGQGRGWNRRPSDFQNYV
jgi:hypothetical protein